jgi:hypothetical protein
LSKAGLRALHTAGVTEISTFDANTLKRAGRPKFVSEPQLPPTESWRSIFCLEHAG